MYLKAQVRSPASHHHNLIRQGRVDARTRWDIYLHSIRHAAFKRRSGARRTSTPGARSQREASLLPRENIGAPGASAACDLAGDPRGRRCLVAWGWEAIRRYRDVRLPRISEAMSVADCGHRERREHGARRGTAISSRTGCKVT